MQTTLLGLAIAIIVALLAALIGPLFVDWSSYRASFEAEASRLAGLPVRVAGPIDVRLLPSPSLTVGDVTVGRQNETGALRARGLSVEFALGPLLRGQFRAARLHIVGADIAAGLDQDGRVNLPKMAAAFDADALSIEQLTIEDGHLVLADAASATKVALDKVWFKGEARSLVGPFKGEGAFVLNGDLYGYRVSSARPDENGAKIKFTLDPSARPLTTEGEGIVSFERGVPKFAGALSLSRAVGVVAGGQAVLREPLRLSAQVRATPASALLEQIDIQYGAEERAIKLTGTAEATFGAKPRLDGVLSARQIDLDRLTGAPETPQRLPVATLQAFAASFADVLHPAIPVQIGIGADAVVLGGATLQSLRGDLKVEGDVWTLDDVAFRAPGLTDLHVSGRLELAAGGMSFAGPVSLSTTDPRQLAAWLEGRPVTTPSAMALRARGEVTVSAEQIAVDHLKASIDGKAFEGRFAYVRPVAGGKARLDGALQAADFDADAMLDFAAAAFGGTSLERPGEMSLSLDLARARIAGIEMRNANAKLAINGDGVAIERFDVGDIAGAAMKASGRIDMTGIVPRGNIALDVDARDWSGIAALAARFAPQAAEQLRPLTERIGPAKLRASFDVDAAATGSSRMRSRLAVTGITDASRLEANAELTGEKADIAQSQLRLDVRLDSTDEDALARFLGIERALVTRKGSGRFSLVLQGPLGSDLRLDSRVTAGSFEGNAGGTLRASLEHGVSGTLDAQVARAELRLPQGTTAILGASVPLTLAAHVTVFGKTLTFENVAATIAGAPVRGRIELVPGSPTQIGGKIELDALDLPKATAAVAGLPALPEGANWPAEPFTAGLFADLSGALGVRIARATLGAGLLARDLHATLRLAPSEVALDDVDAILAGGRLAGALTLRKNAAGLNSRLRVGLRNADAATLLGGGANAPVGGRLDLQAETDATGLSAKALIGALGGAGNVMLREGSLAGLNAQVFSAAMRATDAGTKLEREPIRDAVTPVLAAARLAVPQVEGTFSVSNGQLRLATALARAEDAELTVSGQVDLAARTLDARLLLAGTKAETSAGRPEIGILLKGPVSAPVRTLDVSTLVGWLALRSVEQQARRLEAIEASRAGSGETTSSAPARQVPEAPSRSDPASRPDAAQRPQASAPVDTAPRPEGLPRPDLLPRARPAALPASDAKSTNEAKADPVAEGTAGVEHAAPLPPPREIRPAPVPRPAVPKATNVPGRPLDLLSGAR